MVKPTRTMLRYTYFACLVIPTLSHVELLDMIY
jgi:hypothetical protein